MQWWRSDRAWATVRADPLPVRIHQHRSLLLRRLGEPEMWMQHNKVLRAELIKTNHALVKYVPAVPA